MKTLTYQGSYRLPKLHDELVAAIPALAPVGEGINRQAVFSIGGDTEAVTLIVPDAIDEQQVAAVVAAHDPTTAGPSELAVAAELTNEVTLDDRLEQQLPILRTAIDAITANPPTLFAGLSNQERVFLRRLARNQADLIKLRLRDLQTPD